MIFRFLKQVSDIFQEINVGCSAFNGPSISHTMGIFYSDSLCIVYEALSTINHKYKSKIVIERTPVQNA